MNNQLNISERNELERCEVVIKQGLQTFVEVGQALMLIRDKRLYRAEFGTFEKYCQDKWQLSKRRGYELINASVIVENVRHAAQIQPQNQRQTIPLTKLEPEIQREAWQETVNRHGENITQKKVQEVVKEFVPINNELKQAKKEPMFAAMTEEQILAKAKEIREKKKIEKAQNFIDRKLKFEKPVKALNSNQVIIHGDSREVLPTLQENHYDLLLTDPPYGMDFKSGWSDKGKIANDKIEDTVSLFESVLSLCVPLLKDDAHFYIFGNINYISQIQPIIEKHLNLKNILIWDRQVIGMGDLKSYGKSYDVIYFGYNKKFKELNGVRDRDVLSFQRVVPSKMMHPTEKPIDMLEYLIKKSTNEKDKIIEPFAGGGSTLVASSNTNRICTGIELESKYMDIIRQRI
jgi:site-specific DNA-methyltransferase (adenine-specific)